MKKDTQFWNKNLVEYIRENHDEEIVRKLGDMRDFFFDKDSVRREMKKNPVLYKVLVKHDKLGMSFAVTTIKSGAVGREFYMTKGHYHKKSSPEIYIHLKGDAVLLLQNKKGDFKKIAMKKNETYIIPADYKHRVVNSGLVDVKFITIYPTTAGHDYSGAEQGFKERILSTHYLIGIDFGGTEIKGVLMNGDGKVENKIKVMTGRGRKNITDNIINAINYLGSEKEIACIGISVPGIIDRKSNRIIKFPNVNGFENYPLAEKISSEFHVPVRMDNDGNCSALGEYLFGAGKKTENMVCLTIGTGIGCGTIINGKIYCGRGHAGEVSHITVDPEGFRCSCVNYGCLEEYVSARAIMRLAGKKGLKAKTPEDIATMAKKGNKKAKQIYQETGKYLGIGLADIVTVLDPELILIGGGISKSRGLILSPAIKEMKRRVYFSAPEVKYTELNEWAGAIGAAGLFVKK